MKFAILGLAILVLASCKTGCVIQDTISKTITSGMVATLSCTNPTCVQDKVDTALAKFNLCTKPQMLGGPICSAVADVIVASLVPLAIPQECGCKSDVAVSAVTTVVNAACMAVPF